MIYVFYYYHLSFTAPLSSSCLRPPGYTNPLGSGLKFYKMSTATLNYDDARASCQAEGGGDLAMPKNDNDASDMKAVFRKDIA